MKNKCHKEEIPSLNRIEGQIRGIANMIDDDKYCIDILNQIKAVRNAIAGVEGRILKKHMKECVREALSDEKDFDDKVEEILKTLKRQT
jgi:DNA-binding FrmR family transcriptional regulator